MWTFSSTSYLVINPQWVHENISDWGTASLSMILPEIDLILIISLLEITAKLLPSPIESKNSLIEAITELVSITSSSSKVDRVNWLCFRVGIADVWSDT